MQNQIITAVAVTHMVPRGLDIHDLLSRDRAFMLQHLKWISPRMTLTCGNDIEFHFALDSDSEGQFFLTVLSQS